MPKTAIDKAPKEVEKVLQLDEESWFHEDYDIPSFRSAKNDLPLFKLREKQTKVVRFIKDIPFRFFEHDIGHGKTYRGSHTCAASKKQECPACARATKDKLCMKHLKCIWLIYVYGDRENPIQVIKKGTRFAEIMKARVLKYGDLTNRDVDVQLINLKDGMYDITVNDPTPLKPEVADRISEALEDPSFDFQVIFKPDLEAMKASLVAYQMVSGDEEEEDDDEDEEDEGTRNRRVTQSQFDKDMLAAL